MVFDNWEKMKTTLDHFFTTRRKWKTLEYSVKALSVATVLMIAAIPLRITKEKSWVREEAGVIGRNFPTTAGEIGKVLAKDTTSGQAVPGDRPPLSRASYVLFQNGKVAAQGGGESGKEGLSERAAGALNLVPAEPSVPLGVSPGVIRWKVQFLALEGIPAWVTVLPVSDGRLVLYRPFSWIIEYTWNLSFIILFLTALAIPMIVRKLQIRIQLIPDLLRKQIILYTVISLFPVGLLLCVFTGSAIAGQTMGIHWFVSWWNFLFLICEFLALTACSMLVATRDLNHRLNDSLLVLTNGMEMASNLDFDHPIIPMANDVIGVVAEVFNQVNHLLKSRVHILQVLFNNVRIFSGLLNKEQIVEHTGKTFRALAETGEIVVALLDEETGEMVVEKTSTGRPETAGLRFSKNEGVLGRLLRESHLLVLPGEEYQEIARQSPKEKLLWGKPDFVVGIPMLFKGAIKGGVILYDIKSADYELEVKRDYLQGLANQIAIFLENTRLYSLVIRDRLTGLFVHTFIEAQLENLLAQAKRYKFPVTFIMLDVDKFKLINDQFGHPIGNELLKAVGHAILGVSRQADMEGRPSTSETPQGVARESDLGGRFGGDEFEVILPHTDKEGALIYAERLRKRIEAVKIEVSPGVEARVTISIGLATFPQDAPDVAKLQGAADTALYSAKALGRNNVVAYQTPPESK